MHEFDLDPEAVRQLGYQAVELAAEHRAGLLDRPVFGKVGEAAAAFDEPLPEAGQPIEEVLAAVRERILPRSFGNSHPRFFAFINATADPVGVAADYLAATMNSNCWGGDHAAIHVEQQVLRWLGRDPRPAGVERGNPDLGRLDGELHGARDRAPRDGAGRARGRLRLYRAARRLRLRGGPQLRRQGGRPARYRLEAAQEDPDRRALPDARGPAEAGDRGGPPRGPQARDRRGHRRHGEHGRHRPARRDRRSVRLRGALVPRRRSLRGDGHDLDAPEAAVPGPRAGGFGGGGSAQVALRPLRGRRDTRARARAHGRGLPAAGAVPGPRSRQPGARAGLVQRARARAVARLQGAQGLDGPEAPRRPRATPRQSTTTWRWRARSRTR